MDAPLTYAAVLAVAALGACGRSTPGSLNQCQLYRPHLAKRSFDGRVGAVLLRNAGTRDEFSLRWDGDSLRAGL